MSLVISKILQDIKSVFIGQDWKKLLKVNIAYLAFFYVGNIFSAHVRAYQGGDIIDRIMTAIVELETMKFIPSFHPNDLLISIAVAGLMKFIVYTKGKKAKKKDKETLIKELEKQMKEAAKALDFERAMELRDMMLELQGEV